MDTDWTPQERQKKIIESLYINADQRQTLADRARVASEALWATCHNNDLPKDEMLSALCLITGFTCAVLHDCAKALDR